MKERNLTDFNKPDMDKIDKCIEEIRNGEPSFMAAMHKITAEDVAKHFEIPCNCNCAEKKEQAYTDRLENIIDTFGAEPQIRKAEEELLELALALKTGTIDEILEEMTDVQIMLDQMKILFGSIEEIKEQKLTRTEQRIKTGYYNI